MRRDSILKRLFGNKISKILKCQNPPVPFSCLFVCLFPHEMEFFDPWRKGYLENPATLTEARGCIRSRHALGCTAWSLQFWSAAFCNKVLWVCKLLTVELRVKIQCLRKTRASGFLIQMEEFEPGNPDSESQRDRYQNCRDMGPSSG